ncbi:hypothetical protein [Marinitenerispora sediminis]|nr:hypothetical protein [Marinitenerispora sediminis]
MSATSRRNRSISCAVSAWQPRRRDHLGFHTAQHTAANHADQNGVGMPSTLLRHRQPRKLNHEEQPAGLTMRARSPARSARHRNSHTRFDQLVST